MHNQSINQKIYSSAIILKISYYECKTNTLLNRTNNIEHDRHLQEDQKVNPITDSPTALR